MFTRRLPIAFVAGTALLAGCSTVVPRDRASLDPAGQVLRVEAAGGGVSRMTFRPDGKVVAAVGERTITGDWTVEGDELCFRWGTAPVECWPYARPFERQRTLDLTSDRGNRVRVTRL